MKCLDFSRKTNINNILIFSRYLVSCKPHKGRHIGVLVSKKLDKIINRLELLENDICSKSLAAYNASNMRVAGKESDLIDRHHGCVDHTLN